MVCVAPSHPLRGSSPSGGSLTALSVTPWACHLPRKWEAKVASLPRWGMGFVRGGLCRKENLVYVVGVDVLGDPCDQRDRRAVGVEKKSVFVGETISLPRAINNRPYEGK